MSSSTASPWDPCGVPKAVQILPGSKFHVFLDRVTLGPLWCAKSCPNSARIQIPCLPRPRHLGTPVVCQKLSKFCPDPNSMSSSTASPWDPCGVPKTVQILPGSKFHVFLDRVTLGPLWCAQNCPNSARIQIP